MPGRSASGRLPTLPRVNGGLEPSPRSMARGCLSGEPCKGGRQVFPVVLLALVSQISIKSLTPFQSLTLQRPHGCEVGEFSAIFEAEFLSDAVTVGFDGLDAQVHAVRNLRSLDTMADEAKDFQFPVRE